MNTQAHPESSWEALDAAIAQAAKDCIDLMDKVTLATAAYRARNAELAQLIDSRSKEHVRFLEERKGLR